MGLNGNKFKQNHPTISIYQYTLSDTQYKLERAIKCIKGQFHDKWHTKLNVLIKGYKMSYHIIRSNEIMFFSMTFTYQVSLTVDLGWRSIDKDTTLP